MEQRLHDHEVEAAILRQLIEGPKTWEELARLCTPSDGGKERLKKGLNDFRPRRSSATAPTVTATRPTGPPRTFSGATA